MADTCIVALIYIVMVTGEVFGISVDFDTVSDTANFSVVFLASAIAVDASANPAYISV